AIRISNPHVADGEQPNPCHETLPLLKACIIPKKSWRVSILSPRTLIAFEGCAPTGSVPRRAVWGKIAIGEVECALTPALCHIFHLGAADEPEPRHEHYAPGLRALRQLARVFWDRLTDANTAWEVVYGAKLFWHKIESGEIDFVMTFPPWPIKVVDILP